MNSLQAMTSNNGSTPSLERLKRKCAQPKVYTALWGVVVILASLTRIRASGHNNFLIFQNSFWHLIRQADLYSAYPQEYYDYFLYTPLFAFLMAPFAVLPPVPGVFVWNTFLSCTLFYAIYRLEEDTTKRAFLYWFVSAELLVSLLQQQFNVAVCSLILLTFVSIRQRREGWAAFFLILGLLTKVYGVVGWAFLPFVHRRGRFIGYAVLWLAVLGTVPLLTCPPSFLIDQYEHWINILIHKNDLNTFAYSQNISLLGLVRKISGDATYSDLWIIGPMVLLFALPFVRVKDYRSRRFQLLILAQTLLYVVLLSTGSESSSYIIALMGVGIIYLYGQEHLPKPLRKGILAGLFTAFVYVDLLPAIFPTITVMPYLKALFPSLIVLINCCTLLLTSNSHERLRQTKDT